MNQESYIAGYSKLITETMYKPQEDYVFVNNIKAKEFTYNPHFKREPEGPFIIDYYQHYEVDKPQPNALYSPIRITKESVNRQCNPFVAYPFGVPQKYEHIKCPKCNGNASYGKKIKIKKDKKNKENDLFTSALKSEHEESIICWSNNKHCVDTNPFTSCSINSYGQKNFKTASFKSVDLLESNSDESKMKNSTQDEEEYENSSKKDEINEFVEYEKINYLDPPSSYQTQEYLIPSDSYSRYSNGYITDTNKNTTNNSIYSINNSKLYTIPNPMSEGIITSNELCSSVPCDSMQSKTSPRGKGKLYLKLNNTRINEYSNVLSSEGISESYLTDQNSEQISKSDEKNNKERKKVKISVKQKNEKLKNSDLSMNEKGKNEESIVPNENNETFRNNMYTSKKKSLKLKISQTDIEKNLNKQKIPTTISDQAQIKERETKRSKEPTKRFKNKKSIPIRKISVSQPSVRKASGETYLRMCKMQLAIDTQLKNKQNCPNSNKGIVTSDEDLFGSISSRNIYSKSRVIYLQDKKTEPQRKISTEGNNNNNNNNNLSVSPRVNSLNNTNRILDPQSNVKSNSYVIPNSDVGPNSNLSVNTNMSVNTNQSSQAKINSNISLSKESNINQSLTSNIKKKKIIQTNKNIVKESSKENNDIKKKKENISASPRKIQILNKNNKIANKNGYQKKITLARKFSSKSSNTLTDRKNINKNSVVPEVNPEMIIPKKTSNKSISGSMKNSNVSVNKTQTNNSVQEFTKYKNGLLKKKASVISTKNIQDNKKNIVNTNKGMNDIQVKKLNNTFPMKKKKTLAEETKQIGNKNLNSQIKEEIRKKISSISDSALVNESEEIIPRMEVKFGRSETKLYMPNHKIVPFKKTEVKMITKRDSGKIKTKVQGKVSRSGTSTQRKVKELAKTKKINTTSNAQSSLINKNIKGNLKIKKKELYDNIMLLSKTMTKKNDTEEKTTKNSENKNYNQDSEYDSENLNNKISRTQTIKDKKRELLKKEKKEVNNKNMKKKEKIVEKKEKKGEEQE